jgi:perosamine synthetase
MYPEITKIYIPNNVFIAPWNCGLMEYDIGSFEVMKLDHETMNIDVSEEYFKTLEANAAVVIVHNLGNIVNVPRLKRMRPDLIFVEDNCEGLFGKYEDVYSGSGEGTLCSAVSFYGNKSITTGEGGAFLTNNLELYKYIKTYFSHGMSHVRYIHNILGTNYRMTNVQAGFLYDQMNDITHILDLKRAVFNNYLTLFTEMIQSGEVVLLKSEKNVEKSNWMFVILMPNIQYSRLEAYMLEKNVQIRPIF